jgi:hypothetical protein
MMKNKILHTSKAVTKKKIDLLESKPTRVKTVTEKKPPLKLELIEQLKVLQKDHDILKLEHKKNLCIMRSLRDELSKQPKSQVGVSSIGSQTFYDEIKISCNFCIYVATCKEELHWHMEQEHDDQSGESHFDKEFYCDICSRWFDTELEMVNHRKDHQKTLHVNSDKLYCNFCEETFVKKKDLMKHKKNIHTDKVSICWKFATGTCDYGDQNCWFSHIRSKNNLETVNFKCNSWEKVFKFQSELLRHKKQEHTNLVPICRNSKNGTCIFGTLKCWFVHERNETEKTNKHI